MSSIFDITAELRADEGKGASRRLRRAGKIPAVVYGGDRDPVSLQLLHNEISHAAASETFYTSILQLVVDGGKKQKVILRDMQRHPWRQLIMHMDFQRISETEELRMHIPFHFENAESSPAGKTSGVVISYKKTDVLISCLPKDLPEFIAVDLSTMDTGDIVHLSDIILPEGVQLPELQGGDGHDATVASVVHVGAETEEVDETEEVGEDQVEADTDEAEETE